MYCFFSTDSPSSPSLREERDDCDEVTIRVSSPNVISLSLFISLFSQLTLPLLPLYA